jgi:hypothetical protein
VERADDLPRCRCLWALSIDDARRREVCALHLQCDDEDDARRCAEVHTRNLALRLRFALVQGRNLAHSWPK